jgi:hypothetical protein
VSIASAMLVSASVSQLVSGLEPHFITSYSIASSYATYYMIFGLLYYHDNKARYQSLEGNNKRAKLRSDLIRLVLSAGIAEIGYFVMRWTLQYYMLSSGNLEPYMASIMAHLISAIVFAGIINLGARATKLFHRDNAIPSGISNPATYRRLTRAQGVTEQAGNAMENTSRKVR